MAENMENGTGGVIRDWIVPIVGASIASAFVTAVIAGWLRNKLFDGSAGRKQQDERAIEKHRQNKDGLEHLPEMTLQSLRDMKCNQNSETQRLLLSVNGRVLDVSDGADFYGTGGPYEKLAFADASRALAKMRVHDSSLDNAHEPADVSDLTDAERDTLLHWERKLADKYPSVARLAHAPRV